MEPIRGDIHVSFFGPLEMESQLGRVTEPYLKSGRIWLLLKYMLVNRNRSVTSDELLFYVYPPDEEGNQPYDERTERIQRSRLQSKLEPLGLTHLYGNLILYAGGVQDDLQSIYRGSRLIRIAGIL